MDCAKREAVRVIKHLATFLSISALAALIVGTAQRCPDRY